MVMSLMLSLVVIGPLVALSAKCSTPSVGLFVFHDAPRVANASLISDTNLDYLFGCLSNIAEARKMLTEPFQSPVSVPGVSQRGLPYCIKDKDAFRLDVYLGFSSVITEESDRASVRDKIAGLPGAKIVLLADDVPGNNPIRSFFLQLQAAAKSGTIYDVILKVHTDISRRLMKHSVECLCGSPSHVVSIFHNLFDRSKDLDILTAQGVAVTRDTSTDNIAPFLITGVGEQEYRDRLDRRLAAGGGQIRALYKAVFNKQLRVPLEKMTLIEGSIFWAKNKPLSGTVIDKIIGEIVKVESLASMYADMDVDGMLVFELLLAVISAERGRRIACMIPAPKILPIYFPQYHSTPENDRFWSPGFTEWTLLKPLNLPLITKPLSVEKGGLGYYNLTDREIRKKQSVLNRQHGGHGFMFYHYWFSGEGAPEDHKVLYKIPELMLLDGEPNTPFLFSWANEPWTRRWTGKTKDIMLTQDYGKEQDWVEHFEYLLPFFEHRNYVRINGRPVFVIYRFEHMGRRLQPMLRLWNRMAIQHGFTSGLYIIVTIGNFFNEYSDSKLRRIPEVNALFQFWPMLTANYPKSTYGVDINVSLPQYWGTFSGFDPRPRRPTISRHHDINPTVFEKSLKAISSCSSVQRWRILEDNFVFVTAWNEWNEQAILEPNTLYGNGFLSAMRYVLQTIPSCRL